MSGWRKDIGAITLFVEDPGRAKLFYQKVFELQPGSFGGESLPEKIPLSQGSRSVPEASPLPLD